jgi:nucleotide-binding universal stress UspA family protein
MSTTLQAPTEAPAPAGTTRHAKAPNPARRGPILLASDGTGESRAPVVAARLIADRLGVPLEVVTVLEPQVMYGVAIGTSAAPMFMPDVEETRRTNRATAVQNYIARFSGGASPVPMHVRLGGIAEEIGAVARERRATLVVVGAAPHQRVNRMIAGERAVQVLRASSVPVLSVPPGFTELPRQIVVAVDFAPASIRAAQAALFLLADGGTLTLLHVLSPLLSDAPLRDSTGRDPATAVQTMFERLRNELRPYVPDDATIETRQTTGDPIAGIFAEAAATDAALIAVGTHGPRFLERLFVGSVASSIVHTAEPPVLAAPSPPPAEALEFWLRIAGTASTARPRDWEEALDGFTRRNVGHRASVDVGDPSVGAQMLARGYALSGVTYDPHDKRVEIMLIDPSDARRHLMHSVPSVDSVAMTVDDQGREVLELSHGRGHTLVVVGPA